MMNEIDSQRWQQIRGQICLKLNHQKNHRTLDILATTYGRSVILPLHPFLPHTHIQRDIERCIFIAYIHTYIYKYIHKYNRRCGYPVPARSGRQLPSLRGGLAPCHTLHTHTYIYTYLSLPLCVCVWAGTGRQAHRGTVRYIPGGQHGHRARPELLYTAQERLGCVCIYVCMYVCGSEFLTMLWRWVYVCGCQVSTAMCGT
jgi:hypothetical protein